MFLCIGFYLNKNELFYLEVTSKFKKKMILEFSFVILGGANLDLEKSWNAISGIMKKYPYAKWKKVIDWKSKKGKYIVQID